MARAVDNPPLPIDARELAGRMVKSVVVVVEGPERLNGLAKVVVVRVGRPLSLLEVGRSIELLYRSGAVDDVVAEADIVDGGVAVRFRVWPSLLVRRVRFRGGATFMKSRMREELTLRAGSTYTWTEAKLQAARLERFLQTQGYFRTRVDVDVRRVGKGEVDVRFLLRGKGQSRIRDVVFEGNETFSSRTLARALGVEVGEGFRPADLEHYRKAVLRKYHRKGFLTTKVKVDYTIDPTKAWVTLHVSVQEGPIIRFEFWRTRIPPRGPLGGIVWYRVYQWWLTRRGPVAPRKVRWIGAKHWLDVLDIEHERQFSTGFAEEAEDRIRSSLIRAGFNSPEVSSERTVDESTRVVTFQFHIDPGEKIALRKVTFAGEMFLDDTMLRSLFDEAMLSFAPRGVYTEEALDQALALMTDYYRSQGFLQARLSRKVILSRGPGVVRASVHVRVDEGKRTLVRAVELHGCAALDVEAVRQRITIVPGESYDPAKIRATTEQIKEFYAERGYVNALVMVTRSAWNGDPTAVVVRFDVDEGALVRVGEVIVRGARRTRPHVIARELTVHPGDVYSPVAIEESRTRLRNTGLFQKASIYPVAGERVRDLMVDVQERKAQVLSLSGGFLLSGYDTSLRSAQFDSTLELTHYNLWGLGHRLSGRMDLSTSYLPRVNERQPEEPWADYFSRLGQELATYFQQAANRRLVFSYQMPYVLGVRVDTVFQVTLFERRQLPTYLVHRNILAAGVSKDVAPYLNLSLQLQTSVRRLDEDQTEEAVLLWDVDREQRLFVQGGGVAVLDKRARERVGEPGYLFSLQGELVKSFGCGSSWEGLVPCASGQWRSDELFARGVGTATLGLAFLPWLGSEFRLTAGYVATLEGQPGAVPVERRFYLGGAGTVRGFLQGTLGPQRFREKGLPPQVVSGWTIVPTGGNLTASYSVEALFNLEYLSDWFEDLEWAVFQDAGNVFWVGPSWTRYQEAVAEDVAQAGLLDSPAAACVGAATSRRLRYSVGTGLRWKTSIGMIRFDVGFPVERLCSLERPWAAHLSIGVY